MERRAMRFEDQEFLTARQVAGYLNIGVRTVWRWASNRRLPPPFRCGRIVRWRKHEVNDYLEGARDFVGG